MNDSGFKTKAITRPDVFIPTGMLDIVVILRGNLVKANQHRGGNSHMWMLNTPIPHFLLTWNHSLGIITLILLLVMLTCVFFGFRQKSEILDVPVATLFAFTQLRGSMPDAPLGFGKLLSILYLLGSDPQWFSFFPRWHPWYASIPHLMLAGPSRFD